MTALELQLAEALAGTVTRTGHLPWCNHRCWVNGFNNQRRHDCDLDGCDGEGTPCIPRCRAVRAALSAAEAHLERQGALFALSELEAIA